MTTPNVSPFSFIPDATTGAFVEVVVGDSGSTPPLLRFHVERREVDGPWIRRATVEGISGTWRDYELRSEGAYQYRVRGVSADGERVSPPKPLTAPRLVGTWMHDPTDPTTLRSFLYLAEDRKETFDVEAVPVKFIGRARRVFETGDGETTDLAITPDIPFGPDHDAAVAWFRDAKRARKVYLYRDGRGRLMYGFFFGPLGLADSRGGTTVTVAFMDADYSEGALV